MPTVLQVVGLYAGRNADGTWTIMKILAVDNDAVHIRTYANKFPALPKDIDPSVLSMGRMNDPIGFGIGHLPIAKAGFLAEKPVLIKGQIKGDVALLRPWRKIATSPLVRSTSPLVRSQGMIVNRYQ